MLPLLPRSSRVWTQGEQRYSGDLRKVTGGSGCKPEGGGGWDAWSLKKKQQEKKKRRIWGVGREERKRWRECVQCRKQRRRSLARASVKHRVHSRTLTSTGSRAAWPSVDPMRPPPGFPRQFGLQESDVRPNWTSYSFPPSFGVRTGNRGLRDHQPFGL